MKNKPIFFGMILLFIVLSASNAFAQSASLGRVDSWDISTDNRGTFWVEDSSKGVCYIIETRATGRSRTYEFLCGGNKVNVQNVITFTGYVARWFGLPNGPTASRIANMIYDAACIYFGD